MQWDKKIIHGNAANQIMQPHTTVLFQMDFPSFRQNSFYDIIDSRNSLLLANTERKV